jgi:hypothetical protein
MTLEEQAATLSPAELVALLAENVKLKRQVEWVQRQLFGRKSEKRLREPNPDQLTLAGMLTTPVPPAEQPPPPTETVNAYQRRFRLRGLCPPIPVKFSVSILKAESFLGLMVLSPERLQEHLDVILARGRPHR